MVQNIHPFSFCCCKFVACGAVQVSLLQTIQRGLPLARGRRALCISCVLYSGGNSIQKKMGITLVLLREPSGLWSWTCHSKDPFLYHFCSSRFVSAWHSQRYCCIASWFSKQQGGPKVIVTKCACVNHSSKKNCVVQRKLCSLVLVTLTLTALLNICWIKLWTRNMLLIHWCHRKDVPTVLLPHPLKWVC